MNSPTIKLEHKTLLVRGLIVLTTLGLVSISSSYIAVMLFVLLGQAHFIMAYIEQFRNGNYSLKSFSRYTIFATFAFTLFYGGVTNSIENPVYKLIYTPYYFYVWTLMHLMVTLRKEDYRF